MNLYQYCANNPIRYKDPSGHGAVEQNPYQRYRNEGAHQEAIDLAGQLYPDLASKQSIVDKYKAQGYKAADALELANREILFGAEAAKSYGEQNMTKAFPDATQPYDPDSDFRLQQKLYEMQNGGDESGSSSTKLGFETWLNKGAADNKVYFGFKNGKYRYTGITKQTIEARLAQHNSKSNKKPKNFARLDVQYEGLTRNQARAIEQYYIENGPNELNDINSISINHRYYKEAKEWAKKYLGIEE